MLRLAILLALPAFAKDYPLCFLTDGPQTGQIAADRAKELQSQHMAHINKMWESGALEAAGPVGKLAGVHGIFVFATDLPTATKWTSQDPKVLAGDLALDCHLWQAPNNLGTQYRAAHGKPGFKEQFAAYVAVFSLTPSPDPVLAQGPVKHPKWKHFAILPIQKLDQYQGSGQAFIWMHDPQVWPK